MSILRSILFSFIFISYPALCFGQLTAGVDSISNNNSNTQQTSLLKKMILPAALTGSAILINKSKFEQDLQPKIYRNLTTNIDNYTRYAPLAGVFIADCIGIEAENHWFDQTKNATFSLLLTQFITKGLKANIDKERPDSTDYRAFPSGHTSTAFASATVLYEEFKNTAPFLAYSGYAFALATGYLRMAQNKHWLSDVLMGAAIGTAVTKIIYHFDYLFNWNPFKQSEKLVLSPKLDHDSAGFYFVLVF
ncbi:phosphatase PAP2 family protein [Muriicola sp. Z0-33]|uniref:phosphatase PAP2 family protein n=1 Tax=Muriicola sp. Z0-33 TaxID=2816957 RepID=UPI00223806DF|nr:phosphatase PAP2 family protein [Muriicola sp. Z0-33]MCW5515281.1 phosphatase PAP2 family protein [Muriicola sp. Z0-33]